MATSLRERNRRQAMDHVRSVAFDLMSNEGFDAVTVERIATRSDISPSTVYRYFGTKEALVLSAERPAALVERLADGSRDRDWRGAFRRAVVKTWAADDSVDVELGLVMANSALRTAWERQLLDQRGHVTAAFAERRGKSGGTKDEARAAACLGILISALPRWHDDGGSKKALEKLLVKSLDAVGSD